MAHVTRPDSAAYVPPGDRIATFDNDGTLWCEKPLYVQLAFVVERVHALAPQHLDWWQQEPFSSVLSGDSQRLQQLSIPEDVLTLVAATHTGMNQLDFDQVVASFFAQAKHPRFHQPYYRLVY